MSRRLRRARRDDRSLGFAASTGGRHSGRPVSPDLRWSLLGALAGLAIAFAGPAAADPHAEGDLSSYAYVEALRGRGQVEHTWTDSIDELELHFPLLPGDRLTLEPGALLALILPDRTRVRVSGPADLTLSRLALARDESAAVSEIELREGELQVVVDEDFLADELPIVSTHAGPILIHEPGNYVFYTDGEWTAATPRSGFLELSTERGSAIVRGGETLTVEGTRWPRLSTRLAGGESALETWADGLDRERVAYGSGYVDRSVWHSSAPLERHGAWVQVGGRHAWHPRVATGWRPYYDGRWVPTPSGYTWVSPEPWGWVTYHYGTWDFATGFGWVWYPGRVYSPAWVYWHWSPSYVGWVPTGYYSSYYGGLHLGVHGWSTASWSTYSNWNFCRTRDVGRRDFRGYVKTGSELSRTARSREVPRGLVTTDTRPVDPRHLESPEELPDRIARQRGSGSPELVDVSGFVSRRDVPTELSKKIQTRAAAPRARPGEAPAATGLVSRAPVLRSRAVPSGAQDPARRGGVAVPDSGASPESRLRYAAPDRGSQAPSGVAYPPRAGSRVPSARTPVTRSPVPGAPQKATPVPSPRSGVSAPPRDPSLGGRVLERIRSRREPAPPPEAARGSTAAKPPAAESPRAAPQSRSAPPPRSGSSSDGASRSSASSASSSERSSGSSRSSSARSTRPSRDDDR